VKTRRLLSWLPVLACLLASSAMGVAIPVNYGNISWVDAGVPIAISAGPTGHPAGTGISFLPSRIQGQTFTTTDGFTLDKIWIKYLNGDSPSLNFTMELRMFKLDDAGASDLDIDQDNLFLQPQIHAVPGPKPNDAGGNYIVFDVENIALDPATAYGFFFYVTDANPSGLLVSPFDWFNFGSTGNPLSSGSHHRLERNPSKSAFDMVFALQSAVLQDDDDDDPPVNPAASVPEPRSVLLVLAGMAVIGLRHRRGSVKAD